ncbi:alpha-amylase family glycosyl hydrolase [Paraliomyxa miuraensis]|uniref:alpha-amylase family glycosyl hydrolase n=1 Tax=Paraliomyxa miuraensis TaxID=376150 RepID=UPI0022550705|nr:alpha-amylase family glycosyl hydrolase [Paraliomyxa miuraensis]MCX4241574.1 alpha-amylase family glycosyl hydrolase [Paraliomyxa miuraensis]
MMTLLRSRWSLLLAAIPTLGCGSDNLLSHEYGNPDATTTYGQDDGPQGGTAATGDTGVETTDTPFCEKVDCGEGGTCNEAEQTCDCSEGYVYDPMAQTCVVDACAGVECGFGELCEGADGSCQAACSPDRTVGDFEFCAQKTSTAVGIIVRYQGAGSLDLGASTIRLNDDELPAEAVEVDPGSGDMAISATGLAPSKYSFLLRMRTDGGQDVRPLFVPQWLGQGMRYADFSWKDGIMYQIMTDRFLNGDPSNDIDNSQGTLAEVNDVRSQWQGGDFRGIIQKIEDGYFEDMGINALWISSPLLNSHNSQPAVGLGDDRRFSSYHSYHPIVTGYTHLDDFGYENPIETAFGTPAELHELVRKAHARGIRVVPDFVTNHVQSEAQIYADHPEWFFTYNPCDGNWDAHRIDCWFTTQMPDFDYGGNPQAIQTVVDHALWMIQEFNFDGFRADALKHMDDAFVRALKTAVVAEIETTVENHDLSEEATVFYMVGESLGGWARYHVRADMVQGQVDEDYYQRTKNSLLTYSQSVQDLANFAIPNDTAYLTPQPTVAGGVGGYAGAIMGNFFGNHDQVRALTEAGGAHNRLRLAQTFLFTSPSNIPMLYQGDDIGTFGGQDPDNRAMHRFTGLSGDEQDSLENARMVGLLREEHPALRRGTRQTEYVEPYFWVYRVEHQGDVVYVAINRDSDKSWEPPGGYVDALGNCSGGTVPSERSCVFVEQ